MNVQPEQSAKSRAAIIAKIQKLSAFTIDRGATEAEAIAAAAKIAQLMSEHNIGQTEASVRHEASHCIEDEFTEINNRAGSWSRVCVQIARLYGAEVWLHQSTEDSLGLGIAQTVQMIKYFGVPADVQACIATTAIIYSAIVAETEKIKGRAILRESFRAGMIDRLVQRFKDLIAESIAQRPTGKGLIVLKSQLVTEEFAKRNLHFRKIRLGNSPRLDGEAYAAGQRAANGIGLGRTAVGPSPRQLRGQ